MSHDTSPHSSGSRRTERQIRVLHVDDDESFLELTAEFLPRVDGRLTVHSELQAPRVLSRLDTEPFDCVVSDFEMPELDGLELLRTVRATRPDLPFILFTGNGSETVAGDAISDGVSDYLQKGGVDRYDLLANRITTNVEKYWTERELTRTRRRYELVGRVTADAFFEWDPQTNQVWRNTGYARIFGYDVDEVSEDLSWWTDRIHPDDFERVRRHLDATFAAGDERYEDTYRLRFGDGSYGSVSVRGHVEYRDGEPTRITGALTDLTEYVTKERELTQAHERLDLALRGTNTGVWHWDVGTDEVVWDQTTVDLFGAGTNPPTTRKAYLEWIHPLDVDAVAATIANALETGETYEVEHRLRPAADGSIRWINGVGSVHVEDGEPTRMLGIVRDVTDRRRAEMELQRQNERLDEFASAVSHDLRGPLSVATGYLDLVEPADDESAAALERVSRAHERMHSLVTDLLTLARQGNSIDTLAGVSLRCAAERAWSMVDTTDATLTVEADLLLWADESRLRQVLENLFSNAVAHATGPDGTVSVVVGPLADDANGFFVEDDGPGVSPSDRESVFTAGYTGSSDGTGFGLAIVSRIAEAHDWQVSLTASETGGARFEFSGVNLTASDGRGETDEVEEVDEAGEVEEVDEVAEVGGVDEVGEVDEADSGSETVDAGDTSPGPCDDAQGRGGAPS